MNQTPPQPKNDRAYLVIFIIGFVVVLFAIPLGLFLLALLLQIGLMGM